MKTDFVLIGIAGIFFLGRSPAKAESNATPHVDTIPHFTNTPAVDIAGNHDFPDAQRLNDNAAEQLKGLCSVAEFQKLPSADRYVYSFETWPSDKDALGEKSYTFNFRLSAEGVTSEKITFTPDGGGPGGVTGLARGTDPATKKPVLQGFGNLDWSGTSSHVFKFDKPVIAFGVILKSTGDVDLRRFFWPAAAENGYPASYTLADGTILQLGAREASGAVIKADTDAFLGVIDRSGRGIISVTYTLKGLAGDKSQAITMSSMAFVTIPHPATAAVINLKSSCDFDAPETIAAAPSPMLPGLATLDDFRFIVGNHRYVYKLETWPTKSPDAAANTLTFSFDLNGKGAAAQKVTATATNAVNDTAPARLVLKNDQGQPRSVLGGLGNVANGTSAEQTFRFDKPVWACGVTYRSPADLKLTGKDSAISYTLSDGTVVNLGAAGGTIAANRETFVGIVDHTDKGISSITIRLAGTAAGMQPVYIQDLAFALAGPPPGDWKLTLSDDFNGDKLNPKIWSTGYKFVDVINNELQGYVPENVSVAKGVCTIKTEHRDCLNTDRFGKTGAAQNFASGAFTSVDKFTQTYGYFEARIKMPKARGAGVWPAFWILPDRGRGFADDGARYGYMNEHGRGMEIDIFEFMPRWKTLAGLFPVHVGCIWSYGPETKIDPAPHGYGDFALDNDGWGPTELDFPNLDSEFHTYGLYWSPHRLIWYVDSKPIYRVRDPKHVPDVPHFFVFNVGVHGNGWGKSPDKSNPTMSQIIADMPNEMQIDYFRAFSGTLEEALPADASDIPAPVTKYTPTGATLPPAPAQTPAATRPADEKAAPAAPANSHIATPPTG